MKTDTSALPATYKMRQMLEISRYKTMDSVHKAITFIKKYAAKEVINAYFTADYYYKLNNIDTAEYYLNMCDSTKCVQDKIFDKVKKHRTQLQHYILLRPKQIPINIKILDKSNIENDLLSPLVAPFNDKIYYSTFESKSDVSAMYMAAMSNNGIQNPEKIPYPVNNHENNAILCISADEHMAVILRTDPYTGEEDMYTAEKTVDTWHTPVKMGFNINSPYRETSACLSVDKKTIYFTSDRKGGFGGLDIYVSQRNKHGVWGHAVNLGNAVNTVDDEETPFLYYDDSTLYFSSRGHNSVGGYDIFYTKKYKNNWQTAQNLGVPYNSTNDDVNFTCSMDMKVQYLNSKRETPFATRINTYMLNSNIDTSKLVCVKGYVVQPQKEIQTKTDITISNLDKSLVQSIQSNAGTGYYLGIMTKNDIYSIIFEKNGQIIRETISCSAGSKIQIIELNIEFDASSEE
ncbi:MAG: hypothetical protein NW207_03255 [Cytophagales bacterium]|nr:hypothetical protein [Cytophagales bacterium]